MTTEHKPAPATKDRAAYGGVSPEINTGGTIGKEVLTAPQVAAGPVNHAAAHAGFNYHGGPVVVCPLVYMAFWGSAWTSSAAQLARANRLTQFNKDMIASKYMNVLSQYGSGFGAGSGGVIRSTYVSSVPNNLTSANITNTLQACINSGALPEPSKPSNQCVMIFLADGMSVSAGAIQMCQANSGNAFGFHSFFTTAKGNKCYYAVIPALNNACLQASCGSDAGCSLHLAQTQEQRQTQVASHEFCEMITDPELNAWFDDAIPHSENSDIVNGQSATITVSGRTWTVQRQYSKADDIASNGANFSVVETPNPLPKLTGGPASGTGAARIAPDVQPYSRLLPLPALHFDAQTNATTVDNKDMKEYAKQVFHPLKPEHVMHDFPAFLTQMVAALGKTN